MTDQEFEKVVADLRAKGLEIDRPVKEHEGWMIGERVRILEDDEDNGLFSGAEGVVVPEEVGSEQYRNVRVTLYFAEDGIDALNEVDSMNIEAA